MRAGVIDYSFTAVFDEVLKKLECLRTLRATT
jgi:hypothetical protein